LKLDFVSSVRKRLRIKVGSRRRREARALRFNASKRRVDDEDEPPFRPKITARRNFCDKDKDGELKSRRRIYSDERPTRNLTVSVFNDRR